MSQDQTCLDYFKNTKDWSLSSFIVFQIEKGQDKCNTNSKYKRLLKHFLTFGNSVEKKRAKKFMEIFEEIKKIHQTISPKTNQVLVNIQKEGSKSINEGSLNSFDNEKPTDEHQEEQFNFTQLDFGAILNKIPKFGFNYLQDLQDINNDLVSIYEKSEKW
nr:887_t:CDS:2 [Entrophospora candida]